MDHKGTITCVGVGPGDPELLTLKAVRLIREASAIVFPGKDKDHSEALKIAGKAVPEIYEKELLPLVMPMTRDEDLLHEAHIKAAQSIGKVLDQGKDMVYLTLGDPSIYCTFSYLKPLLEADGYETAMVSGITSFTASAAALNISLAERDEPLCILPGSLSLNIIKELPGNLILMKSGKNIGDVKSALKKSSRDIYAVMNCGMEGEKKCYSVDDIPDDAGYYTLIIAKKPIIGEGCSNSD